MGGGGGGGGGLWVCLFWFACAILAYFIFLALGIDLICFSYGSSSATAHEEFIHTYIHKGVGGVCI